MTPEKILGLAPLKIAVYNDKEIQAITLALTQFALCKNENYKPETIQSWINQFSDLNLTAIQVIKRIRLASLQKRYGVTEFAVFMDVPYKDYGEYYKHTALPEREELNWIE